MTIVPKRSENMSDEEIVKIELDNAIENPNTIVKELAMKDYMGVKIPVFDIIHLDLHLI